jgi:uncharacterized protein YciI
MEETHFFVYRIYPARMAMLTEGPTSAEAAISRDHFNYLKRLFEEGVVVHVGRTLTTNEDAVGIVVFRAESEAAARAIMENDPGIKRGVHRPGGVFPYRVVFSASV